jgi:hypothetical protein
MYDSGNKSVSAPGRNADEVAKRKGLLPPQKLDPDELRKFVRDQNVVHFKKCLKEVSDEKQRQILLQLLAEELAKE